MPISNCEVNLILQWSENCVLTDMTTQVAVPVEGGNPARPGINALTGELFRINDAKPYV